MKRSMIMYMLLAVILLFTGCGPKKAALVGDTTIYMDAVDEKMDLVDDVVIEQYGKENVREKILNQLIDSELIHREVAESDFMSDSGALARWDDAREDGELTYFVNVYIKVQANIPKSELKKEFEKRKESFVRDEEVKASHILIKTGNGVTDQQALEKITEIQGKIEEDGGNFSDLAKEYSECPSSQNGGDLGFFTRGRMVKPFEDAAFSLKKGAFSKTPVKTRFGYHIIYVTDRHEKEELPFSQVASSLRYDVYNRLKKEEYGIAVYPENISSTQLDKQAAEISKIGMNYTNRDFFTDLSNWMDQSGINRLMENPDSLYGALNDLIMRRLYLHIMDEKEIRKSENFDKYINMLKKEFFNREYVEQKIMGQITISDDEIRKYYENNAGLMGQLVKQYGERFRTSRSYRRSKEKEFMPYLRQEMLSGKKQNAYLSFISGLKTKYPVEILISFSK